MNQIMNNIGRIGGDILCVKHCVEKALPLFGYSFKRYIVIRRAQVGRAESMGGASASPVITPVEVHMCPHGLPHTYAGELDTYSSGLA